MDAVHGGQASRIARPSQEGPACCCCCCCYCASCWDGKGWAKEHGGWSKKAAHRRGRARPPGGPAGWARIQCGLAPGPCWRWRCLREPASMLDLDGPLSGGQGRAYPCARNHRGPRTGGVGPLPLLPLPLALPLWSLFTLQGGLDGRWGCVQDEVGDGGGR